MIEIAFAYSYGPGVGDGHRVRCHALADELERMGCRVNLPGGLRPPGRQKQGPRGGKSQVVVYDFNEWDGLTRGPKTTVAITDEPVSFGPDVTVNPNLIGDGAEYVILRRLFDARPRRYVRKRGLRILRCMGGPGPVENMRAAMLEADVGIIAAGTLLHEACAMGLPTIAVSRNELQAAEARVVAESGATLYLGGDAATDEARIAEAVAELCGSQQWRREMSGAGMGLIDRRGRGRVARRIMEAA